MDQTNQDTNYPACRCLEQAFILTTALLVLLSIYVAWGSWDQATVDSFDYSKQFLKCLNYLHYETHTFLTLNHKYNKIAGMTNPINCLRSCCNLIRMACITRVLPQPPRRQPAGRQLGAACVPCTGLGPGRGMGHRGASLTACLYKLGHTLGVVRIRLVQKEYFSGVLAPRSKVTMLQ